MLNLPGFDRASKAEIYSNEIGMGPSGEKIQKFYNKECKEEAVRLAQPSGKPITQHVHALCTCGIVGRSSSEIEQTAQEILANDGDALTLTADVSNEDEVHQALE